MSKAYDFLKECGTFFVLSNNGDFPAGRPFGTVMEHGGYLYLSTNARNQAHSQLRKNGNMRILALRPGTRDWLRITGIATECAELEMKERMLAECPRLRRHFSSAGAEDFLLFQVQPLSIEFK